MRALLEMLFQRYYREVYCYLYGLSGDASLSEDLASDVFVEVVKSIAAFRGEADIRTWIFSIARYKWYGYLRKQKRMTTEPLADWVATEARSPEERYGDRETAARILELLELEPEQTKHIVLLRSEGYSFCEIGKMLGVSENSARVLEFRVKKKIRERLKKEGFVDG